MSLAAGVEDSGFRKDKLREFMLHVVRGASKLTLKLIQRLYLRVQSKQGYQEILDRVPVCVIAFRPPFSVYLV